MLGSAGPESVCIFFLSKREEEFKGAIGGALLHFKDELEEGGRLPEAQDTDPASPMEPKVLEWIKSTNFFPRKSVLH